PACEVDEGEGDRRAGESDREIGHEVQDQELPHTYLPRRWKKYTMGARDRRERPPVRPSAQPRRRRVRGRLRARLPRPRRGGRRDAVAWRDAWPAPARWWRW